MLRSILLIVVVAIVVFLIKRLMDAKRSKRSKKTPQIEDMVRCKYCGVHIPSQEAIRSNTDYYCSKSHLEADQT